MKCLTTVYCRLFRQILPSPEGMQLLKQGREALKEKDFEKAEQIYSHFSKLDKQFFKVQSFSAAISQHSRTEKSLKENRKLYDDFINKKTM